MLRTKLLKFLVIVSLASAISRFSAGQVASGVDGSIQDSPEAPMPGVNVTITDVNRGASLPAFAHRRTISWLTR